MSVVDTAKGIASSEHRELSPDEDRISFSSTSAAGQPVKGEGR